MTVSRRTMLLLILTLLAGMLVSAWAADPGRSEGYGAASAALKARVLRVNALWFGPLGAERLFACVARRESGLSPTAFNDDWMPRQGVAGTYQLAYPLWSANNPRAPYLIRRFWHFRYVSWAGFRARLADPVQSVRLAYLLYRHAGYGPWAAPGGC